jgi:hypothetical protein
VADSESWAGKLGAWCWILVLDAGEERMCLVWERLLSYTPSMCRSDNSWNIDTRFQTVWIWNSVSSAHPRYAMTVWVAQSFTMTVRIHWRQTLGRLDDARC